MRFFKRHLQPIALLIAISFSGCSGTFLLGVQVFAWAKMTTQFMKHDAPKLALRKTFDEKHPCEICKHLREMRAKQASKSSAPMQRSTNTNEQNTIARVSTAFIFNDFQRTFKTHAWWITKSSAPSRADSPLTPPPKFSLAA